jgi:hypothetical protein
LQGCIFCGNPKVSKEHLFGAWWKKYYPTQKIDHNRVIRHQVTLVDKSGKPFVGAGIFQNVGPLLSRTTKVVCKNCNNEWGSSIEKAMEASFISNYLGNEIITSDNAISIRRWMFLKFCLHMRAYQADISGISLLSEKSIAAIRNSRADIYEEIWKKFRHGDYIPSEYRFYISKGQHPLQVGIFNYASLDILSVISDTYTDYSLSLTCLFSVGEFIGFVTNDIGIIEAISNATHKTKSNKIVYELNSGIEDGPINNTVKYSFIEEYVLSTLEFTRKTKGKFRRSRVPEYGNTSEIQ